MQQQDAYMSKNKHKQGPLKETDAPGDQNFRRVIYSITL